MNREQWLKFYEAQTPNVQDYLSDRASGGNEAKAQTSLAYENDVWDRVMDIVWELLFNQTSQKDFQAAIKSVAGDRKPEDVERALLLHIILPLADLVDWDVETRLQELGVPNSTIQGIQRVSLKPVSYGAAVRRIAALAKLSVLSEETVRRVREILISYFKGVRTVEQVKEMLQRSQAEGGVGFAKTQADMFVEAMGSFLSTTQVLSENEYATWLTSYKREQQEKMSQPSTGGQTGGEKEIQDMAATMPQPSKDGTDSLETALQATLQAIGPMQLDEYLQKRLQNAISTRLRDVRNPLQIKSLLERDSKVGGLGLEPVEAERVAGIIETTYQTYRTQITEEEKSSMATMGEEQKIKMDERRKRESEEHAQWFQDKVQSNKMQDAAKTQALLSLRDMAEAKKQGKQPVQSAMNQPLRPSMEGVIPPTQLVGLAEELGGMTMAEFRRLARDPDQAAEKILQKLDTLQQESFEQWTEGVLAWRRSPLQQTYLKLVTESFATAKPVAQLAEEKRLTDPLIPSTEELGAIIELNSHIQL